MKVAPEVATLLILLLIGALGGGYVAVKAYASAPPDFTVPTTDNRTFTLSEHRGEVVVIDLFATWCASCKIVEGNLKEAAAGWNNTTVTVLSVGIDHTETMEDLRTYQDRHNITWTVARDTDHVAEKYNTFEIARVVAIDPDGRLVYERSGIITAAELQNAVGDALAGRSDSISLVRYGLVGLAMVAGAAAFFSPCAVGMLPAYVMRTVTHRTQGSGPGRTLQVGFLAALGVLLVFFGVGGLALLVGPAITRYVPYLQPLVGFLLVAFGILLLARPFSTALQRWTAPMQKWAHDVQSEQGDRPNAFFAYGLAYGAAAAGCTAPVLLSVLVTAAAYGPVLGTGIVMAYALTGAFFMVLVTVAAAAARGRLGTALTRYARAIEVLSALALVGGGLFLIWFAQRAGTFAART